jgi:hypothetical protein
MPFPQSTVTETFNPDHEIQNSDQFLKQALNAISTIIGVAAALSGNPAAAGIAALITGTVTAGTTAIDDAAKEGNKDDLARVSELAKHTSLYFDAAMKSVN